MKTIIKLIVLGAFLTGCGADPFAILNDEDYDYNGKASELQKYIVTRDVKLEELVGTWKITEKSKEKYIKRSRVSNFFYETDEAKEYREELDKAYIIVKKDTPSKFRKPYEEEQNGRNEVFNYNKARTMYGKNVEGVYMCIFYKRMSTKIRSGGRSSQCFDYLNIDGEFYLANKYSIGDLDAGNLEWRHTLYKKVK